MTNLATELKVDALIFKLKDTNPSIRESSVEKMANIGESAVVYLIQYLEHDDEWARLMAAAALGKIGDRRAINPLKQALNDEDEGVRHIAKIGLENLKELNTDPVKKHKSVKKISTTKTYTDPNRSNHINMATNDLNSIFSNVVLGGNLTPKQVEWIKNVGEDLYNTHGFGALQEVFINVTNRYPTIISLFSKLWDGIGGWAD
jgi:hypothetical protein